MGHPHRMIWYGWCQSDIRPVSHLRAAVSQRQAERHWLMRAKWARDNREPGKLALPGPQLGRLRGGYRLLVLVLRLFQAACV